MFQYLQNLVENFIDYLLLLVEPIDTQLELSDSELDELESR